MGVETPFYQLCHFFRLFAISCVTLVCPFSPPMSFCRRPIDFLNEARQVSKCSNIHPVVLRHGSTLCLCIDGNVRFIVHYSDAILWNPDFLSQLELTR